MASHTFSRRSLLSWFSGLPFENISIIVPAAITILFEMFLLSQDIFWVRPMLGELFTAYFGIVGIVSAALAQFEIVRIQNNVNHLVSMSLRPLEGFAEIFERALEMLRSSDDEFYFASFVGRFGLLHEKRSEVRHALLRLGILSGDQEMATRVEEFEELLIGKVTGFRKLKLVLLETSRLKELVSQIDSDADVDESLAKEAEFRSRLKAALGARKKSTANDCVTLATLPQQVLVARMRRPNGDRVIGCLVFLVGTETEIQEQPIGYYTEAPSIASVYIRYLDAIGNSGHALAE